jgi:hypothetical protein
VADAEHRAHDPAPAEPAPELLVGGNAAYASMRRLVRQAQSAVELETYIFEAGAVGDRFLADLTGETRRGVHVRVLVDAYGSDTLRQDCVAPLIAAGGELRCFNPKRLLRLSFRNHRKLLRADGEAVIGGLKPQTNTRSTSSRSSSSARAPTRTERLPRFRTEGSALPAGNAGRITEAPRHGPPATRPSATDPSVPVTAPRPSGRQNTVS